ncbi:aconitate hydratase AcnA [Sulfolobales archaeon SCGC AB-777_J03]|nr:aconitate hydratase AcnA [Sulfolobales archaeon SCGC AB-777_J03]
MFKDAQDSFGGKRAYYFPLSQLEELGVKVSKLPYSLRVLLENVMRNLDGYKVTEQDFEVLAGRKVGQEFAFMPTRVIMQDYTGVPLLVDLAAMRTELKKRGKDPSRVNPVVQSDLIIDHSVSVDYYGTAYSLLLNRDLEYRRNEERYRFLKWAQRAFRNLRVFPPGSGIIHQVNLEYLSKVVDLRELRGKLYDFPEIVIGTDSHTTMANGIGVLSWGVGGLEAEAVMLGEPYYMTVPEVVGVKLVGELNDGVTATDLALYITELLRKKNVVGKFVEFFGPGLSSLTVPDRATIANMAPEYGATVGYFPIDEQVVEFLNRTARNGEIVKDYAEVNSLWYDGSKQAEYSEVVEVDLSGVEPSVAGPRNPDERIPLRLLRDSAPVRKQRRQGKEIFDGAVVLASITSCTNTSNPSLILTAGLLAKRAVELSLRVPGYVKTSFSPGSIVVQEYLDALGLTPYFQALGFHIVGFGCMTCIGNAGPLPPKVEAEIREQGIEAFGVISGNRNFEGRINPLLKGTYLASPPLVVTFALAGRIDVNLLEDPIGFDPNGRAVYLRDLWPKPSEVKELYLKALRPEYFLKKYGNILEGDERWKSLKAPEGELYEWDERSTYIRMPPWFSERKKNDEDVIDARILLLLGDKITTDHISPAGNIDPESPAGKYLRELGEKDLNTYGARRGNHEVMLRGGFANPKLRNLTVDREGGFTKLLPEGKVVTVYEAAVEYKRRGVPLVVVAGRQYGSGSSRDWAAKVTALLGVRAVIAESFERIHRSNLVAMGVVPVQVQDVKPLNLTGEELVSIIGLKDLTPRKEVTVVFKKTDGEAIEVKGVARVETNVEVQYIKSGGLLNYVFDKLLAE